MTVGQWRAARFEPVYEGLTCDVLDASGAVAPAEATLASVRAGYLALSAPRAAAATTWGARLRRLLGGG